MDHAVPGASGVVSLRRGPITSTRMVGGSNANANVNANVGRPAFNSRDSISSTGSNRYSDHHRFSYDESSAGERDSKTYSHSFSKTKTAGAGAGASASAGFIVDRGMDSPGTVRNRDSTSTGTSGARTSPPQSLHPEEGGGQERVVLNDSEGRGAAAQESDDDDLTIPAGVLLRFDSDESASEAEAEKAPAKFMAKRHTDTSASDLNLDARKEDHGDYHDTFISPPTAGFSSSLEPGIAYDEDNNDTTPLATTATTPTIPNVTVAAVTIERKGATVNRSRTPRGARRPYKGTTTGEEDTSSPTTSSAPPRISSRKNNANSTTTPSRDSPALVSGSEEEGAKADVEDELYTDLVNSYS